MASAALSGRSDDDIIMARGEGAMPHYIAKRRETIARHFLMQATYAIQALTPPPN